MVTKRIEELTEGYYGGRLGVPVFRAPAADPNGGAWQNLFQIIGGFVLITQLIGIRTVIQAVAASNFQLRHSVTPQVLCAAAAVTGDAVGTIYTISGRIADGLYIWAGNVASAGMLGDVAGGAELDNGIMALTGFIQLTGTGALATGSCRWILCYVPLDLGAYVVAV